MARSIGRNALATQLLAGLLGGCASPLMQGEPVPAPVAQPAAQESPVHGNVVLGFARRETEDHLGQTGIHQGVALIEGALWSSSVGIGGELGYSNGTGIGDESTLFFEGLESHISEFYLGPRVQLQLDEGIAIYAGGGVSYSRVEVESGTVWLFGVSSTTDSDSTTAGYVHGGFAFGPVPGPTVQLDGRWTFGDDVQLFGQDVDVDYWQVGLSFGYVF